MRKAADAFRSIGEVSRLVGVPPHVLRYWETQFPQLAPVKRADGRRYYRPEDLHLAAGLCELLREEGMTTKGAARMIARDKGAALRARGLARLPERFRGEAEVPAAEAGDTQSTEGTMTDATTPPPHAEPADERQVEPSAGASPAVEAAHGATGDVPGAGDAVPPVPPGQITTAATEAEAIAAPLEETERLSPDRPAAMDAPETASALPGETPPPPAEDARAASERPQHRPDPAPGDLPLFPGLAPAVPPPGIWLPRLVGAVDTLRSMTPPRRPPAQMQRLRDRLAALIDPEA